MDRTRKKNAKMRPLQLGRQQRSRELQQAEKEYEERATRRALLKREALRQQALAQFKSIQSQPDARTRPPKQPVSSTGPVSRERHPQIKALNEALKRNPSPFFALAKSTWEATHHGPGKGGGAHSLRVFLGNGARLVVKKDNVVAANVALRFRFTQRSPGRQAEFGRQLAKKSLGSRLLSLLDQELSASVVATGYPPTDFEGLKLAVGAFGETSELNERTHFRVEETRRAPAITYRPASSIGPGPRLAKNLDWEVLPRGWWKIATRWHEPGTRRKRRPLIQTERIVELDSLKPIAWYASNSLGDRTYFVAEFTGVAVADCPEWGNALYYYYTARGDWRAVFRQSKAEALRFGARRILHTGDWRRRLRRVIFGPTGATRPSFRT